MFGKNIDKKLTHMKNEFIKIKIFPKWHYIDNIFKKIFADPDTSSCIIGIYINLINIFLIILVAISRSHTITYHRHTKTLCRII